MLQGKWLRSITIAAAIGGIFLQSCKKENGIDNNNIIRTPYGLYFADNEGAMFNTNDGISVKKIFNTDGYIQRSIVTSGSNVLFVKRNLHLSTDNGDNFNPTETTVNPLALWQSVMLDVPGHDRLYLCSTSGYGVKFSEDHGKTWVTDSEWDTATVKAPMLPHTLAQLKGGDLFGFSNTNQRLYKRTGKTAKWTMVTTNSLPVHSYFLSRLNDALVATDISGADGVFFSNDKGSNWTRYGGLPAGVPLMATYAPFDQTLLVGTKGMGVFRLESGNFVASNNGLLPNTTVYSIVAKSDTYKNNIVKQYVYIAGNTGLYRSEDGGKNWIQMIQGDIRLVY